jgi:hypothetical protein
MQKSFFATFTLKVIRIISAGFANNNFNEVPGRTFVSSILPQKF